ncbi:MAG TPA: CBS domain-containing protein [Actinomycetota bacterium]|nr:CBS domain-containing protein [Actinomycetota bacterium]
MKVGTLCRHEVMTAGPEDSLADVASRMQYNEVSALAVFEDENLVGIVTERDLVRAMAEGVDPAGTAVVVYMTPDPLTIDEDAEAAEAAAFMLKVGARHLPVVDGGRVVGMISARDLLEAEAQADPG